mgnify:CR=1 FL=1
MSSKHCHEWFTKQCWNMSTSSFMTIISCSYKLFILIMQRNSNMSESSAWLIHKISAKTKFRQIKRTHLILCYVKWWCKSYKLWSHTVLYRRFVRCEQGFNTLSLYIWINHTRLSKLLKSGNAFTCIVASEPGLKYNLVYKSGLTCNF